MPANILNLSDYKVVWVEENTHDYHISAEVSLLTAACVVCNSERLIGHGRNEQIMSRHPDARQACCHLRRNNISNN